MNEKIELNLTNVGNELVIRSGSATPIYDPVPLMLAGTIAAPGDFFEIRRKDWKEENPEDFPPPCTVVANYSERTIKLRWDDASNFANEVTGTLKLSPELAALTVNAKKTYNHRELLALIKFQGAYFANREDHEKLIASLKAFEVKIEQNFKDADDYKGAAAQSKLTKINHEIPLEMKLTMAVFGGCPKETFKVDICVGLVSGSVDFWLESTALHEMIILQTEKIFEEELARFEGIVVVKQY